MDDIFNQFFRLGGGRESWVHSGNDMQVDLELPGVDPTTISVSARGPTFVIARWIDRYGSWQTRTWDLKVALSDMSATFSNGLLRIRGLVPPQPPAPKERTIPLTVL